MRRWNPKNPKTIYSRGEKLDINNYIANVFKRNGGKCLVLDSSLANTTQTLINAGIPADNIITINDNVDTIKYLNTFGTTNICGDVFNVINTLSAMPPNVWLDLENNMSDNNLEIIKHIHEKYCRNSNPCWFITTPTRKSKKSLRGGYRSIIQQCEWYGKYMSRWSNTLRWVYGPSNMLLLQYGELKSPILYRRGNNILKARGFPTLRVSRKNLKRSLDEILHPKKSQRI